MGGAVHKLVFQPPKDKTYSLKDGHHYEKLTTSKGNVIITCFLDFGYDVTVLFSHGNAEDLGTVVPAFEEFVCPRLRVNAMLYEYTGYSFSTGTPTETALYADAECAFQHLTKKIGIPENKVLVYGRSLGSGPSVHLAMRHNVLGVMLQSPLLSCYRVALKTNVTLPGDMFCNIDKVKRIRAPVMVIHGMKDTVVPFYHGKTLFKNCRTGVSYLWLPEAGHNDIEMLYGPKLFNQLHDFAHSIAPRFHAIHRRKEEEEKNKK